MQNALRAKEPRQKKNLKLGINLATRTYARSFIYPQRNPQTATQPVWEIQL